MFNNYNFLLNREIGVILALSLKAELLTEPRTGFKVTLRNLYHLLDYGLTEKSTDLSLSHHLSL